LTKKIHFDTELRGRSRAAIVLLRVLPAGAVKNRRRIQVYCGFYATMAGN